MSAVGCGVSQTEMVRAAVNGYPARMTLRWLRRAVNRSQPMLSWLGYLCWALAATILAAVAFFAVVSVARDRAIYLLFFLVPLLVAVAFGWAARLIHGLRQEAGTWGQTYYYPGTDRSDGRLIISDFISDREAPQLVRDAVASATWIRRECAVVVETYLEYGLASLVATDGGWVGVSAWDHNRLVDLDLESRPWICRIGRNRSR